MIRLSAFPVLVALSAVPFGTALALETPTAAPRDSRIRFVNYEPYNVVRVIGTLRSSVQIQLAPDEEIVHVASGNNVAWEVAPAGNILFLKPREKQPLTNLQVVSARRDGSKRSYQFELSVRDGAVGPGSDTYFLVKFRYPGDEAEVRRLAAAERAEAEKANQADKVMEFHAAYGPRNWRYSAQGSQVIEPVSVYDNGKVTTFAFAGNTQVPAIYTVSADGTESLVPSNTDGDLVTVHAIAAKFILRRGGDVTCIWNEAYDPTGINPGTGTTSPSVSRVMKPQASASPKKN
ncbi:P-type conjugative transfer protein VirB9 [Pararhodobacter sp.]|uniref:P-type conjugative transfer protein VirB9 n=1 Tax=Pararhodobacter sp. TaxID=2127056 RepID=UPI002AFFDC87|nr:P-type conjugative transfer protein VirB9 [Pararhodobacter sp.]